MAKSTKTKTDGEFKIIVSSKTGDKKIVTDKTFEQFQQNSSEAGDYSLTEETFETFEQAESAINNA
jgi:hypothetical protein